MKYLLDTNICIYWLNGNNTIKDKLVSAVIHNKIGIFIITLAELQYGAYNSMKVENNLSKIEDFANAIGVYNIDEESTKTYAKTKAILKKEGLILDDFDILIAATAICNNCILVTNNIKHFDRIEGLIIENWMQ
jgi:tRNA(fMet)-specific endonuclease VapC